VKLLSQPHGTTVLAVLYAGMAGIAFTMVDRQGKEAEWVRYLKKQVWAG